MAETEKKKSVDTRDLSKKINEFWNGEDKQDQQLIQMIGILIGLGLAYPAVQFMMNVNMADYMLNYASAIILGAALGVAVFLGHGRVTKELYAAKLASVTGTKNYRYGLALRIDGNGNIESARLKKHDKTAHYFIDPKTKMPIILDRAKTDLAVQRHSIDGIDVILVNSSDAVPATMTEARAAAQLLDIVYEVHPGKMPIYRTDRDGNILLDANASPIVDHYEMAFVPTYPQMYKIPKAKLRHIGDMVFHAENREMLLAFAIDSVVMDKVHYDVPMTRLVPVMDKDGNPVINEDGSPAMQKEIVKQKVPVMKSDGKQATDENGNPLFDEETVYKKADPWEVEEARAAIAMQLGDEAIRIRYRLSQTFITSGRALINVLYSFVVTPWMQAEMDNLRVQAKTPTKDESEKERMRQNTRTDNQTILFIGAGLAVAIVYFGLHLAGKI